MATVKHTAAPWHVVLTGPAVRWVVKNDDGTYIAQTYGQAAQRADADLIAAAPDLLTALRAVEPNIAAILAGHMNSADHLIAVVRAAIAKAEGSKP